MLSAAYMFHLLSNSAAYFQAKIHPSSERIDNQRENKNETKCMAFRKVELKKKLSTYLVCARQITIVLHALLLPLRSFPPLFHSHSSCVISFPKLTCVCSKSFAQTFVFIAWLEDDFSSVQREPCCQRLCLV